MLSSLLPVPTLPTPPGPYNVGSCIYEIPITSIPSTSPIPDRKISTIKFRLFYPTISSPKPKDHIYWLPEPQNEHTKAFLEFSGTSGLLARLVSSLTGLLRYTTIPAVSNAPLRPRKNPYPVVVFSHGLGGNCNTYSSILAGLASSGVICAAVEHRDGSAPISFIASKSPKSSTSIPYNQISHKATPENMEARNSQLRVRLWELELAYSALTELNDGRSPPNYAPESDPHSSSTDFRGRFDLAPSAVTWCGHSFGAASVHQFVKSVFWHQSLPPASTGKDPSRSGPQSALYTPAENSALVKQITSQSPLILLDMWTMPLDDHHSRWLWERPLPCFAKQSSDDKLDGHRIPHSGTTVLGIMSEAFVKWEGNFTKIKAALSPDPAKLELERQDHDSLSYNADSHETQSTDIASTSPHATLSSPSSSTSTLVPDTPSQQSSSPQQPTKLFYLDKTAHLNQSDFGVLFPWLCKYVLKAEDPDRAIRLNVQAMLEVIPGGDDRESEPEVLAKNDVKKGSTHAAAVKTLLGSEDTGEIGWIGVPLITA